MFAEYQAPLRRLLKINVEYERLFRQKQVPLQMGNCTGFLTCKDIEQAKKEIEMGVSAVHMAAAGGPIAPFFRFPDLQQPPEWMAYLGSRNIAIFSTDIDTFDFKLHKPQDVIKSAMTKLAKNGKGILLMHDFQHNTAKALPELLRQLKEGGYKIVHMVPKEPVTTLARYDDMVRAQDKCSSANNTRPESSVVKTISQ